MTDYLGLVVRAVSGIFRPYDLEWSGRWYSGGGDGDSAWKKAGPRRVERRRTRGVKGGRTPASCTGRRDPDRYEVNMDPLQRQATVSDQVWSEARSTEL